LAEFCVRADAAASLQQHLDSSRRKEGRKKGQSKWGVEMVLPSLETAISLPTSQCL